MGFKPAIPPVRVGAAGLNPSDFSSKRINLLLIM